MKPSQDILNNINSNKTITYRNAVFQGSIDSNKQTRKDFGILYLAKTHQFIVCNNWHNDLLQGQCLFFNDDQKFIYGTWINNIPQGFNVFRFNDILVMTQFRRGRLVKNTPLLIVFEKYNIAAILIVTNQPTGLDDLDLEIYDKKEVFTSQDVRQLFGQCQWPQEYFTNNQTPIKYISYKLTKNLAQNDKNKHTQNPCKLRLVQNKYYRIGYDDGLAIIFDEDFNRISVGSHNKSKLKSFGIAFHRPQPVGKPQKGKIIKINPQNTLLKTALKKQFQKTQWNQQTLTKNISKTNLLTGVNFCNKFYKNPSKLFEFYIQNIVNQASIRNLIAGSLTTRKIFQQSLQFSRIQSNRGNNNLSNEQLFYQNQVQRTSQVEQQRGQQNDNVASSRLSKKKIMQDRLRLQTIKKEIYESLQNKKNKIQKQIRNEQYQRQIINKDMVGGKSHYHTPERTLDKSRSRKRIFQQSQKNLKILRDFTPSRSQPNLTPFKTKMKNRIFYGQQSKVSQHKNYYNPSQSKSRNKSKQKTNVDDEEIQIRPGVLKNFNKFSSADSLDDRDSQVFQRSKNIRNRQDSEFEKERQHQFSLMDYHVSFEDNKDTNKRSNVSSNKYPSQSGKNHNYVPINPTEIKERKRSSKNWISIEDQEQNPPQVQSYKKIHQNQLKNDHSQQKNIQNQRNKSLRQKEKIGQGTIYFPQRIQNQQQQDNKNHRRSKNSLQVTLKDHNSKNHQQVQSQQQQYLQKNSNKKYHLAQKYYQQVQNQPNHQQKNTIKKSVYNEETFKQNTFQEQFSNTQNLDQSKRSVFKHSNQVYLSQFQHQHSKGRQNETQSKKSVRKAFQYTQNKSTSSLIKQQSKQKQQKQPAGISYLQKHKIKKSLQKDIERSPDRHRCYGISDNTPYLQNQPQQYSKELSYHNSNKKPETSYRKQEAQYDDSSYKLMRKQISSTTRNYPSRLF